MGLSTDTSIWQKPVDVDSLNRFIRDSMVSHIGIEFTEVGRDYLRATMPVDERTCQPFGVLHGGASVALMETLGSAAAYCCVDDTKICVGVEINANHVRRAESGYVEGKTEPVHVGSTLHVWKTEICDASGQLISTGRMTVAVLDRR